MDKENVVHLYNGVLYSGKNDILKFAGQWMDLESIILSEVTLTQKDKYHTYSLISGFSTLSKKKTQLTIHNPREPRQ